MSGWLQLPYTDDLFESFRARYGYELRERLADLLTDSEGARRTRCHYWRWVAERFGEAFGGQVRAWCDSHSVVLTGHCLWEEPLLGHMIFSGDLWEALRHFTIPGIDMLRNADGFQGSYRFEDPRGSWHQDRRGNHLTCKVVHAVARHSGGHEMMSEAYGICDWGMNLFRQKCGFNYQVALGVTLFNDNSLITSIADFRKWAIAGKHFTQPWWPYYKHYADYNARLAAVHAEGEPVASVAVLFPRSAIWAKYGPNPPLESLQTQLYELLDELIRRQWHFDFIHEIRQSELVDLWGQNIFCHQGDIRILASIRYGFFKGDFVKTHAFLALSGHLLVGNGFMTEKIERNLIQIMEPLRRI